MQFVELAKKENSSLYSPRNNQLPPANSVEWLPQNPKVNIITVPGGCHAYQVPGSPRPVQSTSGIKGCLSGSEPDSDLEDVAVKSLTKIMTLTSIAD